MDEFSKACNDRSYGLQLLSSIPVVGKFFYQTDVAAICDKIDHNTLNKELSEIRKIGVDDNMDRLKKTLLQWHLAMDTAMKVIEPMITWLPLRAFTLVKDLSSDPDFLHMIEEAGVHEFLSFVGIGNIRKMLNCKCLK